MNIIKHTTTEEEENKPFILKVQYVRNYKNLKQVIESLRDESNVELIKVI